MRHRTSVAIVLALLLTLGAGIWIAQIGAPVHNVMPCLTSTDPGPARQVPCPGDEDRTDPRIYVFAGWLLLTGPLIGWAIGQRRRAARPLPAFPSAGLRMFATIILPVGLVAGIAVGGSGAQTVVPALSQMAPLACPPSDKQTVVQFEPTFKAGDRSPMAAAARLFGVPEGELATYLMERGNDGKRAVLEFDHGGTAAVRLHVVRGPAGWVLEATEGCSSGARALNKMIRSREAKERALRDPGRAHSGRLVHGLVNRKWVLSGSVICEPVR